MYEKAAHIAIRGEMKAGWRQRRASWVAIWATPTKMATDVEIPLERDGHQGRSSPSPLLIPGEVLLSNKAPTITIKGYCEPSRRTECGNANRPRPTGPHSSRAVLRGVGEIVSESAPPVAMCLVEKRRHSAHSFSNRRRKLPQNLQKTSSTRPHPCHGAPYRQAARISPRSVQCPSTCSASTACSRPSFSAIRRAPAI